MAKLNYADFENQPVNETNENTNSQVRFFALKPNESAIVRILCDSVDDFDIHTLHNVVTPQWQYGKRMNCLRDAHAPIEACPLCVAGKPLVQKIFVKMVQYVTDPQSNKVNAIPVVWERSVNDKVFGARALKSYMDTYGPLSSLLCKVTRVGEKLETQYQFIPNLPTHTFPEAVYPRVDVNELFGNYSILGKMVLDKTYEEYNTFLATGNFPAPNSQATPKAPVAENYAPTTLATPLGYAGPTVVPAAPNYPNHPIDAGAPQFGTPAPVAPQQNVGAPAYNQPARQQLPWETPNNGANIGGFERPVRRY